MRRLIDLEWVALSIRNGFLLVDGVIPDDKILRVIFSKRNSLGVVPGDILKKTSEGYLLIKKIGRPGVGGCILSPLTVEKVISDLLSKEAKRRCVSVNDLRRTILNKWKDGI